MCDRMPVRAVIAFTCFGSALACMLLWGFAGTSSAMLVLFVIFFGLLGLSFSACWGSRQSPSSARCAGRRRLLTPVPFLSLLSDHHHLECVSTLASRFSAKTDPRSLTSPLAEDDPGLPGLIFSALACARGIGNIASGALSDMAAPAHSALTLPPPSLPAGPIASALLKSDLFKGGIGAYGKHNFGALLLESTVTMAAGAVVGMLYRA